MTDLLAPLTERNQRRAGIAFARDDGGSILLETALGAALILTVALPFASLVSYSTNAARDLAAVQSAARTAARTELAASSDTGIAFSCGSTPSSTTIACAPTMARGSYVAASKDTVVALPFGLELHTNERAVARVE